MKPIRTLIVDDEELCRKGIRLLLQEDNEYRILGECKNGKEAIKEIRTQKPEVVFLDIRMPEISGFDVLKRVNPEEWPLFVFVTAYDEHAIKAFEVHAIDYVLKPFTKARFKKTLERVKNIVREKNAITFAHSLMQMMSRLDPSQEFTAKSDSEVKSDSLDKLLISSRGAHEIVWVKEIEWIEGADYYVCLHCRNKSFLYRERLKNLEEKLPSSDFFRAHKSAIINLNYLDKIISEPGTHIYALMKSGAKVKISRNRKKALFDLYGEK